MRVVMTEAEHHPPKNALKTETSVFLDSEGKGILLHTSCNQLWLASARKGDCVGGSPIQSILSPSIWSTIQKLWETEKQSKFGVPKIWSFDWVTSGHWWDKRWSLDFFFSLTWGIHRALVHCTKVTQLSSAGWGWAGSFRPSIFRKRSPREFQPSSWWQLYLQASSWFSTGKAPSSALTNMQALHWVQWM